MAQAALRIDDLDQVFDQEGPWAPQEGPQLDAILASAIVEMLYGGAAGGGKTDFLLGDFLQDVPTYGAAWRGILFRKTTGELADIIERSREIYPRTGAFYNESKRIWRWPNGASLRFDYLELDKHKLRHQGRAYTWIGWDELTHWATDSAYRYLRGRLRSVHNVPTKRIRSTANPGGVGHGWVKAKFVAPAPGGYHVMRDPDTGASVVFLPARLDNNKILLRNDPGYEKRLAGMGSAALVQAMRDGDWDVIEGAYFDCWSARQHVIKPFKIPDDWVRFRSGDWGSYSPFSFGWWAVVQDDYKLPDGRILPRGAIVRYREWYGSKNPAVPGKGLKLPGPKVAQRIIELEGNEKIEYGVLDPATFNSQGGPSIGELINTTLQKRQHTAFHKADNTRVPANTSKDRRGPMSGWDGVRGRLIGTAQVDDDGIVDWSTGRPMIYCFDTCVASVRTIPALQHDPAKPEDLDTTAEDHAADDWRYGCNSRPMVKSIEVDEEKVDAYRSEADDQDDAFGKSFKTI